jgi:hypothetical protein
MHDTNIFGGIPARETTGIPTVGTSGSEPKKQKHKAERQDDAGADRDNEKNSLAHESR